MSFINDLLGSRGCNVDGTTSNNPIMRLTDQLMDTFLVPQSSSSSQSAGGQQGGGFEEVSMVARSRGVPGHQGVLQNNNQAMAQQWQSQFAQSQGHVMNMGAMQHQQSMENIWQQSTMAPSMMGMHQYQQRMMMQQQYMAQQMYMQQQQQQQQQQQIKYSESVTQQQSASAIGNLKEAAKESVESVQKEEDSVVDNEVDELQTMLEEAWNAEGMEGSAEEIKAFWEGMLERKEQGELSNDETWRILHEHAMKNSWKPPTTATDSKQDTALGDRMSESMPMQQYKFEVDNPYLLKSSASGATTGALSDGLSSSTPQLTSDDMFEKGMQYYAEGHVDEAILAFEASVQSHPENVDNVTVSENIECDTAIDEIWNMLGKCHAEMDKDTSAIFCLQQALEYDPFNLPALLALGTCHVNEMNPMEALECLQGWVKHNPKFHGLEAKMKKQYNTDSADDVYADGTLMDEVLQLMLAVANFDPTDTDVQVVLGVVQNVTQDLDAAAGAFQKALHQNPQDFSLLNKIGATLANGENSVEAIPYYARALKIRPLYARGWLNLGIAYANLGQYDEAVKAYVQALAISSDAMHIWDYLESIFTFQRRYDLITLSQSTRDPAALAEKLNFSITTPLYSK